MKIMKNLANYFKTILCSCFFHSDLEMMMPQTSSAMRSGWRFQITGILQVLQTECRMAIKME